MYSVSTTEQFEHSLRECIRAGKDPDELWAVVEILAEEGVLPEAFKPHMLTGIYAGFWECHIDDDWLLVWRQDNKRLTLLLTNTGTHKSLFG
ncbi:MAG: type II toxin-antitoxin system YafQ family toxin [Bacteroidales bacterium]|nr:type II toxin-antitoxin system YafQ family toxin [Candidatus Liminaster caballi]